ncbi:unnamed protein product [Closterium sp. Yama58-4]|nr:unnamed protein product [Closterium sp. Yama58-4]
MQHRDHVVLIFVQLIHRTVTGRRRSTAPASGRDGTNARNASVGIAAINATNATNATAINATHDTHGRNGQDENMDEGEETSLLENVNATTVIVTGARSRDDETSEVGKAMTDLEEWIEKQVEAIAALAEAIRTEWESGEAPSSLGTNAGRKRARVADDSTSEPMQHLAALSAHAEAIREKVRGVGRFVRGLEERKAQGGKMKSGEERGENMEKQSGGNEEKEDQIQEEKEDEGAEGEKEAQEEEGEGDEERGVRDEEGKETTDLVDETMEEGNGENLKRESAGEAREELEEAVLGEGRGEEPVGAAGAGPGEEGREGHTAEREGGAEECENGDEDAEEGAVEEGVGDNYDLVEPLVAQNGGEQDKGAGLGDEARDIMRGGGGGVVERAGGERSGAGEAVGNDLVESVERWAQEAGLCGAAAAVEQAAAAARQVQSALVEGEPTNGEEAFRARLHEKIDALLLLIPPDQQVNQTRMINKTVRFLSSLLPKTQQSTRTVQRIAPETQQLNGNPAAAAPQITPELHEITLSNRNLHYFLSLAPTYRPTLLPSLASLSLDHCSSVSPRDILSLVHLPSLTSLSFLQTPIAPAALSLIQPFSRLHQLVLDCPGPSTLAFKTAPWQLKNLKALHLSRVTNAVLEQVGVLTSLEVFSCTCCEGVTFTGWLCLVGLKRLRQLCVAPADLDRHGLRMDYPKGSLPVVSRVFARPQKKQGGVYWERVQEHARLKHFEGLPSQEDDSGVWHLLSSLRILNHLELHAPPRYKYAYMTLDELSLLTTLRVMGAFLDDDAFKRLTRVMWLTHLSLAGCTFATDSVVMKIAAAMPKLESLDLSGTSITLSSTPWT